MSPASLDHQALEAAKPEPKDLSHHFSLTVKKRQASQIKRFYKYFAIPGIGQLAGGLPNNKYFPYDTLEAKTALPQRWNPTPNEPVEPPTESIKQLSVKDKPSAQPVSRVVVPHTSSSQNPALKIDLDTALQYGQAQGYPPLYSFLFAFARRNLHPNVPYKGGPEIVLTCGNTDGFNKAIELLNDDWHEERDPIKTKPHILCEEYAYMNGIQDAKPRGFGVAPVKVDDEGMCADAPGGLRDVLENWDFKRGRRPHLMYTVTIGQNPTGATLSVSRRKELYELCVKYDVIIIEDEPYWYLQYPSSARKDAEPLPKPEKSSGYDFLDSLIPSYLSVDHEGRVVRLDTFSKTVAPGTRLGWITAQPAFIERLFRITETSTQQPSGFVQSMIAEMIIGPAQKGEGEGQGGGENGRGWETDGWVRWLEGLRGEYERRMNEMCDILEGGQYQVKSGTRPALSAIVSEVAGSTEVEAEDEWSVIEKTQIFKFNRPLGGMFVWIRFDFSSHPLAKKFAGAQLAQALWLFWTKEKYRVLLSPGTVFAPNEEIKERDAWQCFRLCFSAIEREDLGPVTKRVVAGAQAFWRIKSKDEVQKLLDEVDAEAEEQEGIVDMMGMGC